MDEKRRSARTRALKGARIVFDKGTKVFDCTIRNRSANGAQLQVASVVGIPDRFELLENATGERRPVTVVWRKVGLLGVAFDTE